MAKKRKRHRPKKSFSGITKPTKKSEILDEFFVRVYSDGKIRWNGADKLIWWLLHLKRGEGFLPYVDKISKFAKIADPN